MSDFRAGDPVHTPFGKGTVREVRKNHRVLVDVRDRAMLFAEAEITAADEGTRRASVRERPSRDPDKVFERSRRGGRVPSEIDLHGLTVDQALERAERALNDALLADLQELRFVHGRSGGRIRGALHRWLREVGTVRSFRLDPRNDGVTIVSL